MRKDAQRMLHGGMSSNRVLAAFASDYGEGILTAPSKSGFNLTAWVLPFAVLAAGGLLVGFSIRAWRPKAGTAGVGEVEVEAPADPTYVERIERELEEED
jgi:cytochrome c-type biogenesis protein CcmH